MNPFRRQPVLLIALITLAGAQAARADKPTFHHHHEGEAGEDQDHYKDTGEKPPSVKVKRTVFTSRALIGKNGVTDLEVTTGTLDSTSVPPGYLSEVHVKALRLDGKEQFEKEFEHLRRGGGYAKFSFPLPVAAKGRGDDDGEGKKDTHLVRGQTLRVKVEGKGLLSGDDDDAEARLENTVKYRPDLTVSSLQYPPVARSKVPVDIVASVLELMSDTGAHSDCILSVDGAVVDTVPGMWVDKNGAVTCHFLTSFAKAGQHTLSVSVQNICPGDYDNDNNSLSGTIKIEDAAAMSFNSNVVDQMNTSTSVREIYTTSTPATLLKRDLSSSVQHTQTREFNGDIPTAVSFPIKTASFTDQTDGSGLASVVFANLAADSIAPMTDPTYDTVATVQRFDSRTGAWFTLRRMSNSTTGVGLTHVNWNFPGGDVTYHSEHYCQSVAGVWTCAAGDYSPSTSSNTPAGATAPVVNLGKAYGADAVLDDGTAYQAHPRVDLTTGANTSAPPPNCVSTTLQGSPVNVCRQSTWSSTTTTGSAMFTPPSM